MNTENQIDNPCIVEYSNYFYFEGKKYAFRKKELFEITHCPKWIPLALNNGSKGFWIKKTWLSLSRIKELIKHEPVYVDISSNQWYIQEVIKGVFNLHEIK